MVICALMVAGCDHRDNGLSVGKRQESHLRTHHAFFNNDRASCFSKSTVTHHGDNCLFRLIKCLSDNNALTECESVRLDNDRHLLCLEVSERFVLRSKCLVLRGRDIVFFHQFFGESLRRLDDRRICVRSESADPGCFHRVDHAECERVIRCYEYEIELFFLGIFHHRRNICCLDRFTVRDLGDTAVTGCTIELRNSRALRKFPTDCMFTATAAYD